MRTLYLVRHAKSSWENPEIPDFQRPLLEKGKKRTKQMIDYLESRDVKIDLMISSHAKRARETAEILAHAFQYPADQIKIDHLIYEGDEQQIANSFFDLPSWVHHLWIIGHNPSITNFANLFLEKRIEYLPTSGIISINFETDSWEKLQAVPCSINFVMYPSKVKSIQKQKATIRERLRDT
ncbi:MAG: histidine phosphatase family protein [Bacteroidales bacterium]